MLPEPATILGAPHPPAPLNHAPRRRATFRALRSASFRRYFAGQITSASGSFLQQTAIAWLVLELTGSAAALGLVLAVGGIPGLVLGPLGGTVADRIDNRILLLATQSMFAALATALWVAAAAGHVSVTAIVTLSAVGGVISVVDSPARQAFVSQLVTPEDLSSAISLNGVVMNSARVVGPAVAGVLIVTVGITPCFAINAISYAVIIIALLTIKSASPQPVAGSRSGVRDAVRYVNGHEQLRLPLLMMAVVGLFSFNFGVVIPLLAHDTFHGNGATFGVLSTVLSIGSVAGSLVVGAIGHPRRSYLVGAVAAFGVSLVLAALAPTVFLSAVALLLTGFTGFTFVTMASTTLQLHADPAYRGRVMALWVFVYLGTTPLGSVVTGALSATAGPRSALWLAAAACALAAAFAARVHTPPHPDTA